MLIGRIDVRARKKILVTIREGKKGRTIDMRIHDTSEDGELVPTSEGISLTEDQVHRACELLMEAKARLAVAK